jgi:glutamate-ammonia-ligase adenylyltransferase
MSELKLPQIACLSEFAAKALQLELPFILQQLEVSSVDWHALRQQLHHDLQAASTDALVKQGLRQWRLKLFGLIAVAGLLGRWTIQQEFEAISKAADLLIQEAYAWLYPRLCEQWGHPQTSDGKPINLLILAMGKYGGHELNFSSDVDLIFFYADDGVTQGGRRSLEHQTFFIRLGQQLIALLDDVTQHGSVFRVDMRLRPYGDAGPLAMSFQAAEEYYQEQGREWERFAMIKARLLTGDDWEQRNFYQLIRPFVYRRYIDFGVLESIRSMKSMIETEVRRRKLTDNIKLGSGGIREAEFIVQSLQLIKGGRNPELQERSFIGALAALARDGMIQHDIADKLQDSYLFLRKVEHVLQQLHDQQTQSLPQDPVDQHRLTVILGFQQYPELLNSLRNKQQVIAAEFRDVFRLEQEDAEGCSMAPFALDSLEVEDIAEIFNHCAHETVEQIVQAVTQFSQSASFHQLSSRGRSRLEALFPLLLQILAQESQPVVGLQRLLNLLRAVSRRTAYLVLLQENPPVLQHLVKLCCQSEWVAQRLAEYPVLLDELLYPSHLYHPLSEDSLHQELRRQMLRIDADDEEQQQEQLRIFKQSNELRVAAAVLNETINVKKASRYLSQIASAILSEVTRLCWRKLCLRYGVPNIEDASLDRLRGFATIAYGKFGGEELGFGSDLDLVFLFSGDAQAETRGEKKVSHMQFFTRLAQRIINTLNIRTLSGVLYEVDIRLRPSGNSGLLVSHCDAFHDYQFHDAWTWEHQALTRARAVSGDQALCQWFEQVRLAVIALPRDPQVLRDDVITMRQKMRLNLDQSKGDLIDLKQGIGTMVDIEFLAQYLLLSSGHQFPKEVWSSRTTRQFIRLAELGKLDQKQANVLVEAYRYYRLLLNQRVLSGESKLIDKKTISDYIDGVTQCWQSILQVNN